MLRQYIENNIVFKKEVKDWEEAIRLSASSLLDKNAITTDYVEAIIQNVHENGPYFVMIPYVAIPHARKEFGANEVGLSVLKLEQEVMFPNNQPVKLLIALSSDTDDGHLELLSELSLILMDEGKVKALLNAGDEKEIIDLF